MLMVPFQLFASSPITPAKSPDEMKFALPAPVPKSAAICAVAAVYPKFRPPRPRPSLITFTTFEAMLLASRMRNAPPGFTVIAPVPKGVPARTELPTMLVVVPPEELIVVPK